MNTTKNNITGDNITTANKPMTGMHWDAMYERVRSRKNPRDYDDAEQIEIECMVCEKVFNGGSNRIKCQLCK